MPLFDNLEGLEQGPSNITRIQGDFRRGQAAIAADRDLTPTERKRALADLTDAVGRALASEGRRAADEAGRLEAEIERVEAAHPPPSPAEIDREWRALEPLLEAGLPPAEVLERHVHDRAGIEALRTNLPRSLEVGVLRARPNARSNERAAAVRSIQPRITEALEAVRAHEMTLLPEPLRAARHAAARASAAADSMVDHVRAVSREISGGRRVSSREAITLGMRDPVTVKAAATRDAVPPAYLPNRHEIPASGMRMRAMLLEEERERSQADPALVLRNAGKGEAGETP